MTDTLGSLSGPASGTQSTAEAAREQATNVAHGTAQAGTQVAQTAVEQTKQVASSAGHQAQDLIDQARTELTSQASSQQERAAGGIRTLSEQLRGMATGEAPVPGPANDLVSQAADKAQEFATWLENREPGELISELRDFGRRRPGAFLVGAAVLGVVAGRVTRGAKDASSSESSQPAEVPERFPAGVADSGYASGVSDTAYAHTTTFASTPTVGSVPAAVLPSGLGYDEVQR